MKPINIKFKYYLLSFALLCSSPGFGAASSSDQPNQTQATLQDDEPTNNDLAEYEALHQEILQSQNSPVSSSGSAALPDDQTRKRTERAAALQAFGKSAKRPRTRAATHAQDEHRQQFVDAISQNNVAKIIEAYDQFVRNGGNPEELQNMPEFIEYLNGEPILVYLHQLSLKYLNSANEEIMVPFKKLLLMSPATTHAHTEIKKFLQTRLTIKLQHDEQILIPIPLAIEYSELLQEMYAHQLPLKPHEASTSTLLNAPLPLEEPETLDFSNFSKNTFLRIHNVMYDLYQFKLGSSTPTLIEGLDIDSLNELYKLAEFLRVTKPIWYLIDASAINMIKTTYNGDFQILNQLYPFAQQSIAAYSFLSTPQSTIPEPEYTWRKSKTFTISIAELIAWNKIRPVQAGDLNLEQLHIADLTGLVTIPGIQHAISINLSNNFLKTLNAGIFSNLPVVALWLKNNQIAKIDHLAFAGMDNLVMLLLDDNQISSCPPGTFANLHNIQILSLIGNPIGNNPIERKRIEEEVRIATNGQGGIIWGLLEQ